MMNDPTTDFLCIFSPAREKDLWRQTVQSRFRDRTQPNYGRIQQRGKASYYVAFEESEGFIQGRETGSMERSEIALAWLSFGTARPRRAFFGHRWVKYLKRRTPMAVRRFAAAYDAEPPRREGFLDRASRLEKRGQLDAALDLVYDQIDEKLSSGSLDQMDRLLANVDPESLSTDLLLGLLTATLPARSRLPARNRFYREVERVLRNRPEWEEGLLAGLES